MYAKAMSRAHADNEKAAACGWLVIRTIPSELLRVKTIQQIVRACKKKLTIEN